MIKIADAFQNGKAFIPFLTCGDPDLETTETLVKAMVAWHARRMCDEHPRVTRVLLDILDTPISPELLPVGQDGALVQKTEETLGKYDLHDFALYHMLRGGYSPQRILEMACIAYPEVSRQTVRTTLKTFYRRFFTQQFKRSCLPDGPKVGSVTLSPRGDWRMPSDASWRVWEKELQNL